MFLLVLLFIVVPLVELYVIIQVGQAIGIVPTLLILLADALLGSFLLRHQGRAAWVRFNRALAENRMPHKEVMDGVLVIVGGTLLLAPGFITDIFGLILLIPPTRAAVRGIAARLVAGRLSAGPRAAHWGWGRMRDRRARRQPAPGPAAGQGTGTDPQPPPRPRGERAESVDWEEALYPGRARRTGPRPDDIEGTGHEVRDENELPPGEESKPR